MDDKMEGEKNKDGGVGGTDGLQWSAGNKQVRTVLHLYSVTH